LFAVSETLPTLKINRRAALNLRDGHLWVYRSDLEPNQLAPAPGALVSLSDNRNAALGTAIYSSASQIAARRVSPEPALAYDDFLDLIAARVGDALERRRIVAPLNDATNAQRLLFSEADNLPGIIVDRYNDLLLVQLLTQGTANDDVRAVLVQALRAAFPGDITIWERPDPRIRELEQLPLPENDGLLFTSSENSASANDSVTGKAPATTTFTLNGLRFHYDAAAGQKTGAFLDQRLNYAAAAAVVKASGKTGRALDVCTYHGGFALHLAQVCESVTGIDQSRAALETADWNLSLNPQLAGRVDWIESDAFEILRAFDDAHNNPSASHPTLPMDIATGFDAVVLDPPAFAKSKRALEGAMRGYKELNLRAIRLLSPGGTLVTCSCSHHVSLADFTATVAAAAADAGRRVQLLDVRAAAPDHPEIITLPETRYLKCLIARVD
jgi:23S rRNA (cytosine1962-C5)-methyltransferase